MCHKFDKRPRINCYEFLFDKSSLKFHDNLLRYQSESKFIENRGKEALTLSSKAQAL